MRACVEMDVMMIDILNPVVMKIMELSSYLFVTMFINYVVFISNRHNYVVLTLCSELLSPMRGFVPCYVCKVIIDMHREYMKLCM